MGNHICQLLDIELEDVRLRYYNEYFNNNDLSSLETSQWKNLFNNKLFEHNNLQLVFTFPINTVDLVDLMLISCYYHLVI